MIAKPLRRAARALARALGAADVSAAELARLRERLALYEHGWPPGHFYSPYPSLDEVRARASTIFSTPGEIPGVDLNDAGQLALFAELAPLAVGHPLSAGGASGRRYRADNPNYNIGEALIAYCMMRYLAPRRVVEVGSGYSSCVLLDANEVALGYRADLVCIEPYPELLRSLLAPGDAERVRIIDGPVQDVAAEVFDALGPGDLLFIDSSHVAKCGSDVNHLYFDVLPRLRPGVYVHVHDVPYPFEYPRAWVEQQRAWNEAYLVRAFLQFNTAFEIAFFNSHFAHFHAAEAAAVPEFAASPGSSVWMRRRADASVAPRPA